MPDLNKMTLDEVLDYCHQHELWLLKLWIDCDGIEKVKDTIQENAKK